MGAAVRADESVTFFRRKRGHVLLPGRVHAGKVRLADIGIPERVLEHVKPRVFANAPALWAHSRCRGSTATNTRAATPSWCRAASRSTGAARLAARGALRAGAGLVTLASPREALAVNAAASLAVMVRAVDGAEELAALLADRRLNAVALGPGLGVGAAARDLVRAALGGERAVVLDADALTSFADAPDTLFAAIAGRPVVLTPHQGEFARLFKFVS